MRAAFLALLLAVCAACLCAASVPATDLHQSPLPAATLGASGQAELPHANPAVTNGERARGFGRSEQAAEPAEAASYASGTDFMGRFGGVPVNPTAHLQRSLEEDRQYIAAIMRAPLDLGDPTDCKHSDLVKGEQELRKIALRINHRRVSLRQQQHWIDSAREGLERMEREIASTTQNAQNLAEQLDALHAQRQDIVNHVRRAVLLKELDQTSSNLMRLKNARMKEEVSLQQKHNDFALKNHEHNTVLGKLHDMRTKQGLALGKLEDPKPYRFAQEGLEAQAEEEPQSQSLLEISAESEVDADAELDADADADADSEADVEAEGEAESEVEADAEQELEQWE